MKHTGNTWLFGTLPLALLVGCGRTALGEDFVLADDGTGGAFTGALGGPGPNTDGAAFGTDGTTGFTSSGGVTAMSTTWGSTSTPGSVTATGGQPSATSATGPGGHGGLGGAGGVGGVAGANGMAGGGGDCGDACAHSWGEPKLLETDDGGILTAEIAMNDAGSAVVAWFHSGSAGARVSAASYTPDTGWDEAELLGDDGVDVEQPRVAIDDEGSASVIWRATEDVPNLRSWRFTVVSGWEETEFVNPNAAAAAYTPDVAMDANDTTLVAWNEYDGTNYDLWSNRFTPDEGWASAVPVQLESENNAPALVMNASGDTLMVWSQTHEQQHDVWASSSAAGIGWTTPELIQNVGSDLGQEPDLAIDPEGNGIAVWHQYRDGGVRVWANRFAVDAGWGTPEIIETAPQGAYFPRIGMDGAGNALAVWRQSDGTVYDVWSNRYTVGSGWAEPERISGSAQHCQPPEIAVGSAGDAVAVWSQTDSDGPGLWANRYVPGVGWGEPEFVDVRPGLSQGYDVAIDGEGKAIVVWSHSDGGSFDLWGATSNRSP